jgi:CPA1 family monovalent cation:H+ antiporter
VHSVATVLALVVLATAVATTADRLKAPAPSLLVLVGLGLALIPGVPDVEVTPNVVSLVVLPPLLYAAATDVSSRELRAVLGRVAGLAFGLVLVTAAAVAVVVWLLLPGVTPAAGFVLGAVLASTDPVAVSALGRRLALPPRLLALVQGESLLNDATSLVMFRIAVAGAVAGGTLSVTGATGRFLGLAGGGATVGVAVAICAGFLRSRTEDPVLETVLALVTPYAAYVLGEALNVSGVTAVVLAGLVLGARTRRFTSGPLRLQVAAVYDVLVFLLESVVFALIGLQLPLLVRRLPAGRTDVAIAIVAVTAVLLLTRLAALLPAALVSGRRGGSGTAAGAAVATWAGTRGVVPLAAALSMPLNIPGRPQLLVVATGVIVVTLVVQGLTLAPLVRRLGVTRDPQADQEEEALARHRTAVAALSRLEELVDLEAAPPTVAVRLRADLSASTTADYRRLRRELLAVEAAELLRLSETGQISEPVRRRLQRGLDLEEAALDD